MQTENQTPLIRKTLYGIMLLAVFLSALGAGSLSPAGAQEAAAMTASHVLSDGQFVYGPNVGDFVLKTYLEANAPHLLNHADDLYERAKYFSINPKIYLTLLEIHSHSISAPEPRQLDDPFGLGDDFISQFEYLSNKMSEAYYLHLYTYSGMPVSQRHLESFVTPGGGAITVAPDTNAGTYAIIAGLAAMDQQNISSLLDNSQADGFYQTYLRLFPNDDPLDEKNHITIPGEIGALAAPDNLLQLPWLRGSSWFFGGVHSNGAGGVVGSPYTDASALDFSPGGLAWGSITSNAWVVASASGVPEKISNCYFSISHSGGWKTTYYHIENIQNYSGWINQNDKIGVIANTLAEATCSGGSASGPHVHFNLMRNGALYAINGSPLSGWYVHAGRYNYDTDPNYMWLERGGVKKYPNINTVLSEAPPPLPPVVVSSVHDASSPNLFNVKFIVTFSETVTGISPNDFTLTTSGVSGAAVSGVSGSGSVYTVTVNAGAGTGTIRLNVVDDDSIKDLANLPLAGSGIGNGNFTSGETFAITAINLNTYIGGNLAGTYLLAPLQSSRDSHAGVNSGPMKVMSTDATSIIAATRILYEGVSYSEMMGFPANQLTTDYWFPYYNNVAMSSQLRVSNVGGSPTHITVTYSNGIALDDYDLAAGAATRKNYPGINSGPLHVTSSASNILTTIRVLYGGLSYSELMGFPNNQLAKDYWYPYYNNVAMDSQLRVSNVGSSSTTITVTYGNNIPLDSYTLAAGTATRKNYPGINSGPLHVTSSDSNILTTIRVLYGNQSFSEISGFPANQLTKEYVYPVYDNVTANSQLRVSNVGGIDTEITVYGANNAVIDTYALAAGAATRKNYAGENNGPLRVVSSASNILSTQRLLYTTPGFGSFYELTGFPVNQLTTENYFPWYNNVAMNSQLRIAVP